MEHDDADVIGTRATKVVEHWRDRRWEELVAGFDATLTERLGTDQLQSAWDQVEAMVGFLQGIGRPSVVCRGPFHVVDVPLDFERGPMKARVTYDQEGRISGLFVLHPETP